MTSLTKKFFTPAEYLKFEEAALDKHEYRQGVITLMAGATPNHNRVVMELSGILYDALKRKACEVFGSDTRVQVKESGLFTYPDLTIVCGEPEFAKTRTATLLNPTVIVEVLSPTTREHDRGEKFDLYRPLKSLQAYVLIDPDVPFVDYFQRQANGTWKLTEYRQLTDKLALPLLRITIPLASIYARVDWMKKAEPSKKRKA
jgi:Uma2 family endonuclease